MVIKQIRIHNLRLIQEIEFEPGDTLNLIWGANGSGKTSILEAIYLLARGKSFRKAEKEQLIRRGEQQLCLFINAQDNSHSNALGLTKGNGTTQAKLNGRKITKMSDLARAMPITVITPNSHEILERGPQYRRRFLDWGVFHVEPEFRNAFERFSRALKQRNAALRLRENVASSWDRELIESGNTVNRHRENYYAQLANKIKSISRELLDLGQIQIDWNRGWSDKTDLNQNLEDMRRGDMQAGYTRYGPHRADLCIKLNNQKVEKVASRGQQKMLVVAMHLAQVAVARDLVSTDTVILIDDLTSELDSSNRRRLLEYLQQMGNQIFITGVDNISASCPGFSRVFHVEQGKISAG